MSPSSRSARATPSPSQAPVDDGEANHPRGHCRYILLDASIKGERCGCTGFIRNNSLPGLTCACGHLACFHVAGPKSAAPSEKRLEVSEMDELRARIDMLERDREERILQDAGVENPIITINTLQGRVEELFQLAETTKEEHGADIAKAFGQVSGLWHHLETMRGRMEELLMQYESRSSQTEAALAAVTDRQKELDDDHLDLSERVDQLEAAEADDEAATPSDLDLPTSHPRGRRRRQSFSDGIVSRTHNDVPRRRPSASRPHKIEAPPPRPLPFRLTGSQAWTVHISLLPHPNLGMPFEKDTPAYHRCLSRGLHQMIAVHGADSQSFIGAVEGAFGKFLQGRKWMPLQAQLCDAQQLQGLPMVRKLDPLLMEQPYTYEFLEKHCAVCAPNGKIDSLYIVMREHTLSWQFIRNSPVFMDGLEDCWRFVPELDDNNLDQEWAGTLLTSGFAGGVTTPPSSQALNGSTLVSCTSSSSASMATAAMVMGSNVRKRNMGQMSRTSSFGSGAAVCEGDGSRPKIPRTCVTPQKVGAR